MKFTLRTAGVIVNIVEAEAGYTNPDFDVSDFVAGDAIPVIVTKNKYTGAEFYKALAVGERELLVNKAKVTDSAAAIFEQIKLMGLDFNDADDIVIIDKMVTASILTQPSRDALVG